MSKSQLQRWRKTENLDGDCLKYNNDTQSDVLATELGVSLKVHFYIKCLQ